ncbi:MAG TPA: M23 family metallopeptidase [Bacteroidota bacterium]|nr:M23 family metallopeptidase [Bacteroidota bacterium]
MKIFGREKKKFFYLGGDLKLHEVRLFYLKLASIIGVSAVLLVGLVVGMNQVTVNFLGFGSVEISELKRENSDLRKERITLTGRIASLRSTLDDLEAQGDELRLLVDLAPVDEAVKDAGTGGSSIPEMMSFDAAPGTDLLREVDAVLSGISGELKVQEQSYAQILKKYEYNRSFFSALPALKPMRGPYASNKFGMRMHPILGVMREHQGVDIVGDVGTDVAAAGDGVVVMAGHSGGGYGYVVVINHGYGYQTLYAHLSKVLLKSGRRVKRGDIIARSGKSGLTSGPHLHYEVRHNGVSMNPTDFFFDDLTAEEYRNQTAARQ